MLKSLLAERFRLVIKEEKHPTPSYALTVGKKLQLKEADGSGDTGCIPQSSSAAPDDPGTIRLFTPGPNGAPTQIVIANGTIAYKCRNMTMASFAAALRGMFSANLGVNPVLDQTGLKGAWNFDLKYSILINGSAGPLGDRITFSDAIEKELGLKLEEKQIPTDVLVVQSVNRKPSANPPGTAEAFPSSALPTEFEVAIVKPTLADSKVQRFSMQLGGRLNAERIPLDFLINRAFNVTYNDQLVGVPSWANNARFDVTAKVAGDTMAGMDPDSMAPLMMALLKDRFKLKYHTEEREMPVYALLPGKPKMTKADPSARTWCKSPQQVPGAPPAPSGSQASICQNVTIAQFVDLVPRRYGLDAPIVDASGLDRKLGFPAHFQRDSPGTSPYPLAPPRPAQPPPIQSTASQSSKP